MVRDCASYVRGTVGSGCSGQEKSMRTSFCKPALDDGDGHAEPADRHCRRLQRAQKRNQSRATNDNGFENLELVLIAFASVFIPVDLVIQARQAWIVI